MLSRHSGIVVVGMAAMSLATSAIMRRLRAKVLLIFGAVVGFIYILNEQKINFLDIKKKIRATTTHVFHPTRFTAPMMACTPAPGHFIIV